MRIVSLNIGQPVVLVRHGRQYSTAMNRKPAGGSVLLTRTGFQGDRVSDLRVHGGPDKAACCYPHEHYPYWSERLGKQLAVPSFGENLTTGGLLEGDVCIGDVYRIGGATVQVSQPRQPCAKIALKHDEPELPRWFNRTAYTGFYFRVLEEGELGAADVFERVERPNPEITVEWATRVRLEKSPPLDHLKRLASTPELSASWRAALVERLDVVDSKQD